jgi:hypothetical protein
MSRHHLTFDQSLTALRDVRPWVNPNEGFEAQLREYERIGLDASKWKSWGHVWRAANGGAAGQQQQQRGGQRGFMVSIPPPAGAAFSAGGGAGPSGGQLAAELIGFAKLRVDGEAARRGGGGHAAAKQQQQQQQQER